MRQKIILSFLVAILMFGTGFGGWAVRNIKVMEQAKAIELLEKEVIQTTKAKEIAVNEIKRQLNLLEKALGQANERADNAELAEKTLIEQVKALEIALEIAKKGYEKGYGEGYKTALKREVSLRDPTYDELKEFLARDKTNFNPYIPGKYVCVDFAVDLNNNAETAGIRAGYVWLVYKYIDGGKWANFVNAFQTIDGGLIFIDPQTDGEIKVKIGKTYQGETIKEIIIVW